MYFGIALSMADSVTSYAEASDISTSDFRMPVGDLDAQHALSVVSTFLEYASADGMSTTVW